MGRGWTAFSLVVMLPGDCIRNAHSSARAPLAAWWMMAMSATKALDLPARIGVHIVPGKG